MKRKVIILLVEDDKSMLDGMSDLLEVVDIGYDVNVLTAGNGLEALDIIKEITPDLIVSDIMMPRMDGFQFLAEVQKRPDWIHIPFIFLTARGEKHEIHKGRLSGAALYITKPFHSGELLELIKSQLDRKFQLEKTHRQSVNNLKKDILQILNHEFRTPLTYVTAYYEMLAQSVDTYASASNFSEYLRGIQAGCTRLNRLIEGFIAVIELRTGESRQVFKQNAKAIPNINQIVQEAIKHSQIKAEQQDIEILYRPCENPPVIFGDAHSLTIVFEQLLDNAVKFTAPRFTPFTEAKICVTTQVVDDEVLISVKDNGMGLPYSVHSQVFDLFTQHNRDQLEQQGAGIGLTIAKGMVDLHHGRIELESEEGEGSTFTVVLPVYNEQGTPSANGRAAQQATILLVEDDYYLLEGLKELLEIYKGKYELVIHTAVNGREGLELLEKYQPDLIISDIMMPEMDGYAFLEHVRQKPDWIQIPFIFLTAKGERPDIHRGLRSGAEEYITKPYDSDELLGLVVKQLDRHFRLQRTLSQDFDALKKSILELITPDFRVPLASVANYSGQLEQSVQAAQTESELKESLHGIQASSLRLSSLIEDFISLAELKTGEAEMAYGLRASKISDIGILFYEASQLAASKLSTQTLQIHCPLKSSLPAIFGDREMLTNCIQRIIDIGLRYVQTPAQDKTISLDITASDKNIVLQHRFPGNLSPHTLSQLRQQISDGVHDNETYTRQLPGLSIVKGYIDLHKGHITIENQADYFEFSVMLPITPS
jgi:signal transduction histidine kinase